MNLDGLLTALALDEGRKVNSRGRHMPYKCPADKLTIGYGRNIEDNGISESEAIDLLTSDAVQALRDAADLVPNWVKLDETRQNVCANLAFQLGKTKLSRFVKMLEAVNNGDYKRAADEMRDSAWFIQSGKRSKRLVAEMESGVIA
jgi:lysozyme